MQNTAENVVENQAACDELLRIDDLYVSFFTPAGEVRAVDGISYTLRRGEVLGIVGESGSGKSVSVNALMRMVEHPGRVKGGSITFDGKDIFSLTKQQMLGLRGKEMGMIFQDPMTSLNPVYTIGNQLMEPLRRHMGMARDQAYARAVEMLTLVGVNNPEQRMKQYPHEFSGGMRQRAMIAMTLSCQPKLLIADEPTTALDVTIQAQILGLMKELRAKINSAIILITHDLGIVSDLCDKVVVMYGGRIVERADIRTIFYRSAHPYTQGLLRCLPRLDSGDKEPLVPIEGTPVDQLALPKGCAFAPRCEHCMKVCLSQQPPIFDFGEGHASACWLHWKDRGEDA
ncbi:MAG: ABC transporter ATP-binding protein [Oscillospiraceae bacterium]|nr:ABC transporter ATP-binding protein [Oscillospiraceae bacterium]